MARRLTLDTGALIALTHRKQHMSEVIAAAHRESAVVIIPTTAVVEWWHGRSDWRETILEMGNVQSIDVAIAKSAGELLARLPKTRAGKSIKPDTYKIDATIIATASMHGPNLYTSDVDDMIWLRDVGRLDVRVFGVDGRER